MLQNKKISENSSMKSFPNDNMSQNNSKSYLNHIESKGKKETEQQSNSGTSISSNKDSYNKFISKIKLGYHLKNPENRCQTIILHTSLDRSYELNDSLNQNEINKDPKFDDLFKDKNYNSNNEQNNMSNYTGSELDQLLNNGFMLDNSAQNKNKRETINQINKKYEEEKKTNNERILDINDIHKNQTEKVRKDNLTINFNNNMFFVNDNKKKNSFPIKQLYNNLKRKSDNSFQDKVFMSNNPFEDTYPGLKNDEKDNNDNNNLLPYGFQNNPFCVKNNNYKNLSSEEMDLNPSKKNYDNSNLNNLSTKFNTNNTNFNDESNNNFNQNNKGISPFNTGNNMSNNSFQYFGNPESDLNNNKNNDGNNTNMDNSNLKFSFNPLNYPNNKDNQFDINYTSKIFPEKSPYQGNNNMNIQNYPNRQINDNDIHKTEPNNKEIENNNSNSQIYLDLKQPDLSESNYHNNLMPDKFNQNSNNNNINFGQKPQYNPSYKINIPENSLNNQNIDNNLDNIQNPNNINYTPLNVNPKDDNGNNVNYIINNQEVIVQEDENKSLDSNIEILDNEQYSKNKISNLLKSLLYGLLLGSTVTGLFWLRNEEIKKCLLEKYNNVNFDSIINFFKSIFNLGEFFKKIFSKEKKEVYSKVLKLTFVYIYDFFEKYKDEFRLLEIFLSIYAVWFIIKSLIKLAIKSKKQHK